MKPTGSSFFFASLLALATAACSADLDEPTAASGEDDYKVKPGGSDPGAGKLVVTSPVALQAYDNAWLRLPGNQGQQKLVLDTPIATKEGNVGITLGNRWGNVTAYPLVKAGSTLTFALGAVKVAKAADFGKLAWGTEVGVWSPAAFRDALDWKFPTPIPGGRLYPQNDLGGVMPTVPGTYHLAYGVFDGQDVTVSAGQTTDVTLAAPAGRRLGLLRAPVRELPDCPVVVQTNDDSRDARYAGGLTGRGWFPNKTSQGGREVIGQQIMRLGSGEERLFGEYVGDPTNTLTKTSYTFYLPKGLAVPVAIAAKPGDAPAVTTWARLDVEDVDVAMADGSKRTVRGTWSLTTDTGMPIVAWPGTTGQFKTPGCATGTGIDLPFGRYKLLVRYTREGYTQPATESYDLDLKP